VTCFVYIIGSFTANKFTTYVGWTNNIDERLNKHNSSKGAKSTRGRQWELIYYEECNSKSEALKREYELKNDRKFRNHIKNEYLNAQP
tara:strand:+ start:229 stop:492 length:264 start_codon:yes stop_codon:yes gene_type:complete